jgi:hypothetical protein
MNCERPARWALPGIGGSKVAHPSQRVFGHILSG